MNCPAPIAEIILAILRHGILRIRSQGWSGNAERCAAEADHLHNLPDLLTDYSAERLDYYWNVERPCFIEHMDAEQTAEFSPWWERLSRYIPAANATQLEPSAPK